MRNQLSALLIATLMAASLCLPAQAVELPAPTPRPPEWAQPIDTHYNLYQMTPTLYRSRQPDSAAQPLLKKLGVLTVVDFINESDSKWLSDPAVTQVQIPLRSAHVDDADIIKSLRAIQTAERNGPVLIHCKHGLDRTGLVAAMYRIVVQGWTKQAALDEMQRGGFGDVEHLKYGTAYINNVDVDAVRTALNSGACSTQLLASCTIKGWFLDKTSAVINEQSILWRL